MKTHARLILICCMFFLGACSSASKSLTTEKPVTYDTLIINSVVLKNAELEDDNSGNLASYNAVKEQMINTYSATIEEYVKSRNLFKTVVISDNADDLQKYENPLILQTKFTNIALGSRAKRIIRYITAGVPLVGRGIMKIEATGRLVDGKSSKTIAAETYDTNTSWDAGPLEDNLMKMTKKLAMEYAEFIEDKITSGEPITVDEDNLEKWE